MSRKEVTELIDTIPVNETIAVIKIPRPIPANAIVGFGKANCMEKVEDARIPLTFQRIFDPTEPKTTIEPCDNCLLMKDCVIYESAKRIEEEKRRGK